MAVRARLCRTPRGGAEAPRDRLAGARRAEAIRSRTHREAPVGLMAHPAMLGSRTVTLVVPLA